MHVTLFVASKLFTSMFNGKVNKHWAADQNHLLKKKIQKHKIEKKFRRILLKLCFKFKDKNLQRILIDN